jgi:RNA polymerase sigma-70 factor, ECF subfamily
MTGSPGGSREVLQAAEEIRLVTGAKHGDHASFEALVDRYMGKAVTVAMTYLGDRHEAMDLAQEAFYRVFKTLDRFREGEPFAPWFYRILRNACINHVDKHRRRRARSIHVGPEGEDEMPLPAGCLTPGEQAEINEQQRAFWQAVEKLPAKHREILMLRHFQDLDYAAMADVLAIPIGTVMSRLFHARQKLRVLMEDYMEGKS